MLESFCLSGFGLCSRGSSWLWSMTIQQNKQWRWFHYSGKWGGHPAIMFGLNRYMCDVLFDPATILANLVRARNVITTIEKHVANWHLKCVQVSQFERHMNQPKSCFTYVNSLRVKFSNISNILVLPVYLRWRSCKINATTLISTTYCLYVKIVQAMV